MEPLKEMFNAAYYRKLSASVKKYYAELDEDSFYKAATKDLSGKELNERLRHTSQLLNEFVTGEYLTRLSILKKVADEMPRGYTSLVFPDFVAQYGIAHFEVSLQALKYFTSFGSSEFAVRYYLKKDLKRTLAEMLVWSKDKDEHVRRLASEGCRPRLPWSFKLEEMVRDPQLSAPILENLKADPSPYVRKSVANHLNDISKDNPGFMLGLVRSWDLENPSTAWIVKHASRTLIKKGDASSLAIFKFEKDPKVKLKRFQIANPIVKLGNKLDFSFDLRSEKSRGQKLVVDYVLHYARPGNSKSSKVFKLKDLVLPAGQEMRLKGSRLMKDFTTRKHFQGKHLLQIQINGKIVAEKSFYVEI